MDYALIVVGLMAAIFSVATLLGLKFGLRTTENRDQRLQELNAGADETYFEEKRALESHPSQYFTPQTARRIAMVTLPLSLIAIWAGLDV